MSGVVVVTDVYSVPVEGDEESYADREHTLDHEEERQGFPSCEAAGSFIRSHDVEVDQWDDRTARYFERDSFGEDCEAGLVFYRVFRLEGATPNDHRRVLDAVRAGPTAWERGSSSPCPECGSTGPEHFPTCLRGAREALDLPEDLDAILSDARVALREIAGGAPADPDVLVDILERLTGLSVGDEDDAGDEDDGEDGGR